MGVLGQDWVASELSTKTPYKAFTKTEIHATVGARIGLGSVNVTLKGALYLYSCCERRNNQTVTYFPGNPVEQLVEETDLVENNTHWSEHIDYNERFTWAWQQGRFGFGPYGNFLRNDCIRA